MASKVFLQLAEIYSATEVEFPELKAITLAQWILESGRGTSSLAQCHYNFGGLKWRPEMEGFASPVEHEAHDGIDMYCRFESLQRFVNGYWRFLDRAPYDGWRDRASSPEDFIRFIGPIYAPSNSSYADRILGLVGEAETLLGINAPEDPLNSTMTAVVVLDPGHGGTTTVGGSSPNNATCASGKKEKELTLETARRVKAALERQAPDSGIDIAVHLTRDADTNLGLSARARVAREKDADVFVSIHYNGFNGRARGVETHIRKRTSNQVNLSEDRALAERIQSRMFKAVEKHDPSTKDRGVKETVLGVLNDIALGNSSTNHPTRSCLLEVEFIDNPQVSNLICSGANADRVNEDIADGIAEGIIIDLLANQ